MSEPLHKTLRNIAHLIGPSWHRDFRLALFEAADKLEPPPAPPDSIPVRIAVVIGSKGTVTCLPGDDQDAIDEAAEDVERSRETATHEAIITANIPRRQIPLVTGTVEEAAP